jgi:PAS domain S-box-containing protein
VFSGLKTRLVLILVVTAIPVVALVGFNLSDEYRIAVAGARGELAARAAAVAGNQASILVSTHNLLLAVASRRSVDDQDQAACTAEMEQLRRDAIGVLNAGVIRPDGTLFCDALPVNPGSTAQDRPWFRDAVASDAMAVGGYQIGRSTHKPSINLALAVRNPAGERMVAFAALDLAWLQATLLNGTELPQASYMMVLDRTGTVVAGSPRVERMIGKPTSGTPFAEVAGLGKPEYLETEEDGVPVLAAVRPVALGDDADLFVVMAMPVPAITAGPLAHFYFNLAIVVATAALVIVLGWYIADRSVGQPIARISASVARLGGGAAGTRIGAFGNVAEIAALGRGFDAMASDLEERNETLAAAIRDLRSANDRLNAVIMASPAAIICLDRNCDVTLWNPAAERIFGWSAAEALGKRHPVVPPAEWDHFISRFDRTLAGDSIIGERGTRWTKDGALLDITFNSAPLRDDRGEKVGVLYVVNDLTAQVETERQLQQAQKMESIGQLTGGVAHDFNNLLGVAIGNLELVIELSRDAAVLEFAQAALDACLRGGELTRQLLAFSRRQPLRPEPIEPAETVRAIARLLDRALGDTVTLRFQVPGGLWRIIADPTQLESAILNLAVNARDAMPNGGTLLIEMENARLEAQSIGWDDEVKPGDYVQISVSDTGTGMPPEVMARAFDPFFTTKEFGRGTGLGLSMVYGFTKQSGGHIRIYSEPDRGTTIKLWLPRASREMAGQKDGNQAAGDPAPRGTETILVVEDNASIRKVVTRQLTGLGYVAVEAGDGPAALAILKARHDIDLLFTDVMMPGGMDGRALAREAAALRPGLRVLYTSGFSESLGTHQDGSPAEEPLLSKPYLKQQLAERIRAVLAR